MEVPQILRKEIVVPIPEVIVAEAVRQVPEQIVSQAPKQVPRAVMEYVEKQVTVTPNVGTAGAVGVAQPAYGVAGTALGGSIATGAGTVGRALAGSVATARGGSFTAAPGTVSVTPATAYGSAGLGAARGGVVGTGFGGSVTTVPGTIGVAPGTATYSTAGSFATSGTVRPGMTAIANPAHVQYVTFEGAQLPHFHETHLRTLHPAKLREHANLLYSVIGHTTLGQAVPVNDYELVEWIIWVQDLHLAPLLAY